MRGAIVTLLSVGVIAGAASEATQARLGLTWKERPTHRPHPSERSFQRVGTFANYRNNAAAADETVSEIVAATADGRTLVYTDGELGEIGLIDITNPARPQPCGKIALDPDPDDDVEYEPTSVDVLGNAYALVAADTSADFASRSGKLLVVDLAARSIVREIELHGQPDSLKISPDGRFAAIAIENERNEDLCVGGTLDGQEADEDDCEAAGGALGVLPQTAYGNPPGSLAVVRIGHPDPATWTLREVDLTGLSSYAPEDPEPEFVDVNARNEAVVTLQENNHVAVVDLERARVLTHFPAGTVTLVGVDATEDGVISLSETLRDVPREPDSVAWVPGLPGQFRIATANEGDLFGGSRGFTLFRRHGGVAFDSGAALERIAVRHGHYPEDRSENKGTEPEAIEYGRFFSGDYLFVGSERGGFVAVYSLDRLARPRFEQLLPGPLEPEGLLAIPSRNLLVASGEADDPEFGVRTTVMIYELKRGEPKYPQMLADDSDGSPIPWSALSGMTSVPGRPHSLLAVWDSYYSESRVFRIDVSRKPALVTESLALSGGSGNYDPEGIAIAPDETLWIASEGNATDTRPNLLVQASLDGRVLREVGLPGEILACRQAEREKKGRTGTFGSGFEGVAVLRGDKGAYRLLVAQQRGWDYTTDACEASDDDDGGLNSRNEPNRTRIWIYDPRKDRWSHVGWELAPLPANASWVGLSEITETPEGDYLLIERDNRTGDFGVLKTLVKVDRGAGSDGLVTAAEKSAFDLRPRLLASRGWITDKPEGVAVTEDGRTFVVTDNDGVEDWSGETWFLELGRYWRLFD